MKKDYKQWHQKKRELNNTERRASFNSGEIWFTSLGENIGFEQDGKGNNFLRPVVVFRKFNKEIFWAIPLSSTGKATKYSIAIGKVANKNAVAIISQIRLVDAKRLSHRIGKINKGVWDTIQNRLSELFREPDHSYLSPRNEESRAKKAIYNESISNTGDKVKNPCKKTILLTGGAGFIGSHLCKRLLEEGHSVIAVDNLSTGRKENINVFFDHPNFSFIEHDIIQPLDIQCEYILNFACPASPPRYQEDPIFTWKTSVIGIMNMLELARKNNCPILHASTSEIYGDPTVHPQPETYWGNVNAIGPRSCYDEGKRAAETLCFDYKRQYQTDIRIARIFNTYGPNMDPNDGRVVSNFITQAIRNEPLTIYGNGSQTRSFQYVDDLIDGILKMMSIKHSLDTPINLGNPIEFTIKELAELVIKLTGSKSTITHHPLPEDDPKQRKPDITLAKQILNWHPNTELEEGLLKTIPFIKTTQAKI